MAETTETIVIHGITSKERAKRYGEMMMLPEFSSEFSDPIFIKTALEAYEDFLPFSINGVDHDVTGHFASPMGPGHVFSFRRRR